MTRELRMARRPETVQAFIARRKALHLSEIEEGISIRNSPDKQNQKFVRRRLKQESQRDQNRSDRVLRAFTLFHFEVTERRSA